MSHSRLRRSMSCIAAGLLIVGPVAVFFGGDLVAWHPHKIVVVILATLLSESSGVIPARSGRRSLPPSTWV
jgi:uncharacterized membrane protein